MKLVRYLFVGVIGALAGLLLAPKPGNELRRELEERLRPLLSGLSFVEGGADEDSFGPEGPGEGLQAKIEETRRRLREQAEDQEAPS